MPKHPSEQQPPVGGSQGGRWLIWAAGSTSTSTHRGHSCHSRGQWSALWANSSTSTRTRASNILQQEVAGGGWRAPKAARDTIASSRSSSRGIVGGQRELS